MLGCIQYKLSRIIFQGQIILCNQWNTLYRVAALIMRNKDYDNVSPLQYIWVPQNARNQVRLTATQKVIIQVQSTMWHLTSSGVMLHSPVQCMDYKGTIIYQGKDNLRNCCVGPGPRRGYCIAFLWSRHYFLNGPIDLYNFCPWMRKKFVQVICC